MDTCIVIESTGAASCERRLRLRQEAFSLSLRRPSTQMQSWTSASRLECGQYIRSLNCRSHFSPHSRHVVFSRKSALCAVPKSQRQVNYLFSCCLVLRNVTILMPHSSRAWKSSNASCAPSSFPRSRFEPAIRSDSSNTQSDRETLILRLRLRRLLSFSLWVSLCEIAKRF